MRRTITCIVLLLCAVGAFADRVDDWRRDQTAIETLLQQKRYAEARKASIKLTNHMLEHLGADAEASKLLAKTVSLRASAEEGLGNADNAIWYWQVARLLDPQIVQSEITVPPISGVFVVGGAEPPQVIRKRDPQRPGMVNALVEARVIVELVIDADGVVRQPRIIRSPAPAVSYAALEAVRQWRFRPGKMHGQPVPVKFTLTVDFH